MSDYEKLMNDTITERKEREAAELKSAIERRQNKQDAIDRDAKLVSESEKQYAEIHKKRLRDMLFIGLSPETSKDLEKLLDLSNKLIHVDDQYDADHKKRITILAQMDVLRNKISNAGRNLGDAVFIKKTYYQSVNKDYFLFPDQQGKYYILAGTLGAARTTDRSLQVDENGQPVKIFKQDRIQTSPEIPICDYETVIVTEEKKPEQKYKPSKRIFSEGYTGEQEEQPKARTTDSSKGVSLFGQRRVK